MKIGLSYALEGEIESILKHTQAKRLETAGGVDIYEIEPDIFAFTGGVGKSSTTWIRPPPGTPLGWCPR